MNFLNLYSLKALRSMAGWFAPFFLWLFAGCASITNPEIEHAVVIKNTGNQKISDVYIDYGAPYRIDKPGIRPGSSTHDGGRSPIPEVMKVSWKTPDGMLTTVSVPLKKTSSTPQDLERSKFGLTTNPLRFTKPLHAERWRNSQTAKEFTPHLQRKHRICQSPPYSLHSLLQHK